MQLSETVKLYMTREQKARIVAAMNEYICTVNDLVSIAVKGTSISKYTTADLNVNLPSAIANQCIRDAKSMVNKYKKAVRRADSENQKIAKRDAAAREKKITVPVLKKLCCYINNQNFKFNLIR